MAIAPNDLRPSFGKWIRDGYNKPSYSDVFVYCVHALKRNLHLLVDTERANRLKAYMKYIEQPIYHSVSIDASLIDDFRYLRVQLDELKFGNGGDGDSKITEIFGACAIDLGNPIWNSWVSECKTAIDMFFRYVYYKGTNCIPYGQMQYIRHVYRPQIENKVQEATNSNSIEIEIKINYNDLSIIRDEKGIRIAIRTAFTGYKVNKFYRISKCSIKSDLITLTVEKN